MADQKLAGEFIMRCFHARTAAHVHHLRTRSFAEHKALNDFYDEIIPLIDVFAEAFQGEYGLIDSFPDGYKTPSSAKLLLSGLRSWIDSNRDKICDDKDSRNLQNEIDNVVTLIDSTLYKLKFLG